MLALKSITCTSFIFHPSDRDPMGCFCLLSAKPTIVSMSLHSFSVVWMILSEMMKSGTVEHADVAGEAFALATGDGMHGR